MSEQLTWFKSSYSDSEGGNCLEAALDWRKSTYSDSEGGACVEIAPCTPATIHVRDSKLPPETSPHLTIPSPAWSAFLAYAVQR
ncbi:DUF397 domain-containing protein [Streptomyces sp. BA2]|uniref:DUF397 domain-containing protein n=1 Tax=Streptomyces sp. BA2 TaxID=436595 RepID=UPI00132ADEB6|nr:DUF397 domain-containing protein [Streptomyces sp. BA2]MWA12518.1 DUF397 domain-containing protein [Streptomyces sp. BA2]